MIGCFFGRCSVPKRHRRIRVLSGSTDPCSLHLLSFPQLWGQANITPALTPASRMSPNFTATLELCLNLENRVYKTNMHFMIHTLPKGLHFRL